MDLSALKAKYERLMPGAADLWDDSLPAPVNIARMMQGPGAFAESELQAIREDNATMKGPKNAKQKRKTTSERPAPLPLPASFAALPRTEMEASLVEVFIDALAPPSPNESTSPLKALQEQIQKVFACGPLYAGGLFQVLSDAAEGGSVNASKPDLTLLVPWNSCKAAATLIALFACPAERLFEALKFQSQRLGGLPTLETIREKPTTSFQQAYKTAKERARKGDGATTVISVSLIDVHIFELAAKGRSQPYTSFAHTFVIGIGPEGVIIWQGWGEHGYGLDEYVTRGGARVRSWQEAGDFVDHFEKMTRLKGTWDPKINKAYKALFEVDIQAICGPDGPSRPIVPEFEAWVRLMVFEDVKVDDVFKFRFG